MKNYGFILWACNLKKKYFVIDNKSNVILYKLTIHL